MYMLCICIYIWSVMRVEKLAAIQLKLAARYGREGKKIEISK